MTTPPLPTLRYEVSNMTVRPGVSILSLGETEISICNLHPDVVVDLC